jgi:hypothetical protein
MPSNLKKKKKNWCPWLSWKRTLILTLDRVSILFYCLLVSDDENDGPALALLQTDIGKGRSSIDMSESGFVIEMQYCLFLPAGLLNDRPSASYRIKLDNTYSSLSEWTGILG